MGRSLPLDKTTCAREKAEPVARSQQNTQWRRVAHGLGLLVVLLVYGLIVSHRAIDVEYTQAFTEAPLLLYVFLLLVSPLRDDFRSSLAAALPIVWIYALHDEYYLQFGRVPNFADFALLADLRVALSPALQVLAALCVALPVVTWFRMLDARRLLRRSLWLLAAPACVAIGCVLAAPSQVYKALDKVTIDEEWSDGLTADHWGRVYSALLREVRRRSFARGVESFTPLTASKLPLSAELLAAIDGRNVHLIVLESFIDLRLLTQVRFSEPPLAPSFTRWLDPFISSSVSPVFGGETARAEFEVLCGVPSLRAYGLEFLAFTGAPTYCLPQILKNAGYHTVLTFPHGPLFFNTRRAYPGLGFEERIFGDMYTEPGQESVLQNGEPYLNDAELFPQNLAKVRRLLAARRPFLNYVLTIYGHWTFAVDPHGHPPHLELSVKDEDLRKIGVTMHQRTDALASYLTALRELDPTGIIMLVADHLPPLPRGTRDYERYGYKGRGLLPPGAADFRFFENFLLVFVDGQPRKLPLMRHFDLPHWLLNELTHGAYCKEKRCDFGTLPFDPKSYLDAYHTLLGLASRN